MLTLLSEGNMALNSREEYLKRYLDDPKRSKSKKKTRNQSCRKQSRFKIVDEDIDMKKIEALVKEDDESDEAPFVVNIIDERPEEVKLNEIYSSKHWKRLDSSVKVKSEKLIESAEEDSSSSNFPLLSGIQVKRRNDSEDDLSPVRRSSFKLPSDGLQNSPRSKNIHVAQHDSDSDISPPRVKNTATSDSDLSPPRSKINHYHHIQEDCTPPTSKTKDHHHKDFSPSRKKVEDHHHFRKKSFSHSKSINKADDQHHAKKTSLSVRNKTDHQRNGLRDFSPSRRKADEWCHKQKGVSLPISEADGKMENISKYSLDSIQTSRRQRHHSLDSDFSPPRERRSDDSERSNFDYNDKYKKTQTKHLTSYRPSQYSSPTEGQNSKRMEKRRDSDSDSGSHSDKEHNCSKRRSVAKHHNKRTKTRYDSDSDSVKGHTCSKNKNMEKKHNKRTNKRHVSDSDNGSHSDKESNCSTRKNIEKQHNKRTKKRYDSDSDSSSHSDKEQDSTKRKNVSYLHYEKRDSQYHVSKGKPYRMKEESLHKPHTSSDTGVQKKHAMSTLSGMKAGLQDSASLQEEIRNFKYREKMALEELEDELSGRNAKTVSRDKDTGRRRNLKEERLEQKEKEKKKTEKLEKYMVWGKGLKQKDDQQKKIQEDIYEMSKPLARYAHDDDLEKQLKDDLKEGDPMLEYIKKKRQKSQPASTSSLPVYEGPPAPPNRFNIPPGYRWDGVDRSNGFEKKYFEKINSAKATENQAYLWSVQNM